MHDKIYFNAFNQIPKMGPDKFRRLLDRFQTMEKAWHASVKELREVRIEPRIINEIITQRKKIDPQKEWAKLEKLNIHLITILDKEYPALLKEIYLPPAVLYYQGNLQALSDFTIAIVGTRKPSSYGRQVAQNVASGLAKAGITIISGLALGIDGIAQEAVVEQKGKTVAVLGSGLDEIYPVSNRRLARTIISGKGLILSEFPLGTPPLKHHFPYRNRIISGLSLGTVIIEAGEKSGALITARYALEQNREVFAVPGSIYNQGSVGPNNLIKMGAKLITRAEDILETLHIQQAFNFQTIREITPDNLQEEIILKILSTEPKHIDQITLESNLSSTQVNSALTLMEMKGKIRNLGGMYYGLAR